MTQIGIHTIGARNNVLLSIIRETLDSSDERMHIEIRKMHEACCQALSARGIKYDDLKNALIPQSKSKEIALIFDSDKCVNSGAHGYEIMGKIIPLLDKDLSCSVLVGNYIDRGSPIILDALSKLIDKEVKYSGEYFVVYINNLNDNRVKTIEAGLSGYQAFVKLVDTTYESPFESIFKVYLSVILCNAFLKHKEIILQGNPDDFDGAGNFSELENINILGYPFEENGLICRSIPEGLYDIFLRYKIERPIFTESEQEDVMFSLNAVDPQPFDLEECNIDVPNGKIEYLKKEKKGIFEKAEIDISSLTVDNLSQMISDRISHNYIYNLSFKEYGTKKEVKFNIILEISKGFKVVCSLAYELGSKDIRLITIT